MQEKAGAQGLRARLHPTRSSPKVASHAGAFQSFQKQHTHPRLVLPPSKQLDH